MAAAKQRVEVDLDYAFGPKHWHARDESGWVVGVVITHGPVRCELSLVPHAGTKESWSVGEVEVHWDNTLIALEHLSGVDLDLFGEDVNKAVREAWAARWEEES